MSKKGLSENSRETDVLIIGAGPAGSTAACMLARKGIDVILVDRANFPREKVCGDGMIADTFKALSQLGITGKVMNQALKIDTLRIYSPNGKHISVKGKFASIPRLIFDDILRIEAVKSGAAFLSPYILTESLEKDGTVMGANFNQPGTGKHLKIKSKFTLLATGANPKPLEIFNVCERKMPSAVAGRAYFRGDSNLADKYNGFWISYDKTICPGYGWVFAGPNYTFNIGAGYFFDSKRKPGIVNIRKLWHHFVEFFPTARDIVNEAQEVSPLKSGFLRTAFSGAKINRPGLMLLGEAAGLTYSFSGEGIGKAMESGIIASDLLIKYFVEKAKKFAEIDRLYAETLKEKFGERFKTYKMVQKWLSIPALGNFICWRANSGRYVLKQLEGLIDETVEPRVLFSFPGIIKSLFF